MNVGYCIPMRIFFGASGRAERTERRPHCAGIRGIDQGTGTLVGNKIVDGIDRLVRPAATYYIVVLGSAKLGDVEGQSPPKRARIPAFRPDSLAAAKLFAGRFSSLPRFRERASGLENQPVVRAGAATPAPSSGASAHAPTRLDRGH